MRSYIEDDTFVVSITHMEACRLNEWEVIADRRNPLSMEAKVEIHPYSQFDPNYVPVEQFGSPEYLERLNRIKCAAKFFTNLDLEIYVPPEVSRCAYIAAEHINRDDIHTIVGEPERTGLLDVFPPNGVTLRFDGEE